MADRNFIVTFPPINSGRSSLPPENKVIVNEKKERKLLAYYWANFRISLEVNSKFVRL